jgi:hypothetical protein
VARLPLAVPVRPLASCALLLPLVACGAAEPPEEAIASSFLRFLDALAQEDGGDAADEVSRGTFDWFQEVADRAVEEDGLAGARPAMRFAVRAARMTWDASRLARMDGEELFTAMAGEGWTHRYLDGELQFEVVVVEDYVARIALGPPNEPGRQQLAYVLEDTDWKLDLAAHEREADALADRAFRWAGGGEADAVSMFLR